MEAWIDPHAITALPNALRKHAMSNHPTLGNTGYLLSLLLAHDYRGTYSERAVLLGATTDVAAAHVFE